MLKNILNGLKSYLDSFRLLNSLKLWKYFAIPILICFLTATLIISASLFFAEDLGNQIAQLWPFGWAQETVSSISHIIGGLLILAIGLVLFKHMVMAFSAPFMGPVSEKIEAHYLGEVQKDENSITNISNSLARGIRINVRNLFKELLFVIPLFLLSLIPVIGIIFTIFIFLVQAYYAGFGNMDYTLERHFKYKDSIKFVQKNRGIAIGNGIGFILLLLVPVLGIIIVFPLSVVAATKDTVHRIYQPQHS
ncbi:MAG: EI24 domain-containing protein [Flavobacteriaceae bacterium]|nr:EI24 domain-containing protein [Flavobacteriaceae bacterium]